ncbi:MAG: T9SS type A sorting domain-containing protein [Bacteroidota bacterium]
MRNKSTLTPKTSQKLTTRLILAAGAISLVIALFVVVDFHNGFSMAINPTKVVYFGTNFTNAAKASVQNEGQIYFQANLVNHGVISCGDCVMGTTYFASKGDSLQRIYGSQPIEFFDVVLDNEDGVEVGVEVRIVNSLFFQQGSIYTDKNELSHYVHFLEGAIYEQVSEEKYVDGYVRKTGIETFTFPIGEANRLMEVTIYPRNTLDVFQAAFFEGDPNEAVIPQGSPFPTTSYDDSSIYQVHAKEYWDIDGTTSTPLSLSWDENSGLWELVDDISQLGVVGWDGKQWISLGTTGVSGDLSRGTVTSEAHIPNDYTAFTLANTSLSESTSPAQWLAFHVSLKSEDASLTWKIASEKNTEAYEIERSFSGGEFISVGYAPALGGEGEDIMDYTYTDPGVSSLGESRLYYRLRKVDIYGESQYSTVITLDVQQAVAEPELSLYPNPTSDFVNVLLKDNSQQAYLLRILSMSGQTVHEGSIQPNVDVQIRLGDWAEGTYTVVVTDGSRQFSKKLSVAK